MPKPYELKTLSCKDSDFHAYLLGELPDGLRAIPVQSLNVNSSNEQVTFQILKVAEIVQPSFVQKWAEVFKIRSFLLVGFPLFAILSKNLLDEIPMDPVIVLSSVLSSFALLVGANLLNDFFDHMRGLDRVHPEQQRKPVQKGWVTARATRNWAAVYLVAGLILGLPALFVEPRVLWFAAVPAAAALAAWITRQHGLKFRRGAEFLVFLLVGPLLTFGFQLAVSGEIDLEAIWLGTLTGWLAVFLLHLKNFESLVVNSKAGLESTVVRLGFDRSRGLLAGWWILFLINFSCYHYVYASLEWFWASLIGPPLMSLTFFSSLRSLNSPAGSGVSAFVRRARLTAACVLCWWVVENFWLILVVELGPATGP